MMLLFIGRERERDARRAEMNPFSRGMGPSVVRRNVMMGPIDAPLALPRLLDGGRGGGGVPRQALRCCSGSYSGSRSLRFLLAAAGVFRSQLGGV